MKPHEIKRDKYQYIIKHPWGCPQRKLFQKGGRYTYITQKGNLGWELNQCKLSQKEQSELLASV